MELGRTAGLVIAFGLGAAPVAAQRVEVGLGAGLALPIREFHVGAKLGVGETRRPERRAICQPVQAALAHRAAEMTPIARAQPGFHR